MRTRLGRGWTEDVVHGGKKLGAGEGFGQCSCRTERDGREIPIGRALADGHAVVELEGRKLRGRYALTRTGEQRGREQWLLVKVRDEDADARRNPVSTQPESVISGRTIEDVAAGRE